MKAKLDSEKIYEVFQSHDYLIVPIDKETNRPIADYTNSILKRCSSATDVCVETNHDWYALQQIHVASSGSNTYKIKASDTAFILGSQDNVDFYLIDQRERRDPCTLAWKLPKLK